MKLSLMLKRNYIIKGEDIENIKKSLIQYLVSKGAISLEIGEIEGNQFNILLNVSKASPENFLFYKENRTSSQKMLDISKKELENFVISLGGEFIMSEF